MKTATDIQLQSDGDIAVVAGDLGIEASDMQHIRDILLAEKGDWKFSPITGVGISSWLNAPSTAETMQILRQRIRRQLEADAFEDISIKMNKTNEKVTIDAVRIKF